MARYCANCGTEVEDVAVFCPTCGQPIDQASKAEIPPAPAWPEQPAEQVDAPAPVRAEIRERDEVDEIGSDRFEEPTRTEIPPPAPAAVPTQPSPPAAARPGPARVDLPVTMPVTLSAWLIGGGAIVAAVGVIIGLFGGFLNPIDLLLLLALLAIAATIFFSANVPAIPHLRLVTLVIVLIGFGMALDRIGLGGAGPGELLAFLGTAAAGIGAIILELGRDQPLGSPQS